MKGKEEKLVFEDEFDVLDFGLWKHESTLGGGGNWEFEWYTNNRSNSYTQDSVLFLQPTLTADNIGEDNVDGTTPYTLDISGGMGADACTSAAFYGCSRTSNKASRLVINPVTSARISTLGTFSFKYGRLEVEAKLPKGDWLWPAIWLLPADLAYGSWPASGEIDLCESRGNAPPGSYPGGGVETMGSTLHWGPSPASNRFDLTTQERTLESGRSFNDDFHVFGLYWDEHELYTYIDEESNRVLEVSFDDESMWQRGAFSSAPSLLQDNPWRAGGNNAPFDQKFSIILNVAVGGVNGFFPDSENKPWSNTDQDAMYRFWEGRQSWYSTWKPGDSAMQVNSVRVWQVPNAGGEFSFGPTQSSVDGGGASADIEDLKGKVESQTHRVSSMFAATVVNCILLGAVLLVIYGLCLQSTARKERRGAIKRRSSGLSSQEGDGDDSGVLLSNRVGRSSSNGLDDQD